MRQTLIYPSASGKFAIRSADFVFIDAPSGNNNQEPEWFKRERGYADHEFPGELFDLGRDISERDNLYGERPGTVQALADVLGRVKSSDDITAPAHPSERDSE